MQIGALGDIHGEFETVHLIMRRHADVPLWVCVGDVASNDGEYFAPLAPLHFIKGNNEDFDVLARAVSGEPPAALPPSRGRKTSAGTLKLGKSRDDKRRHFVRDEVLACKTLSKIDLFLTHEAPRPFYPLGRRIDAGKTVLNDVLAAMRPRLHLFGHHHEFTDTVRQNVRSIGLDIVTKSYLLVDAETFKTERLDT